MNRVVELAQSSLDGTLAGAEVEEWRQMLDNDPEARRIWLSLLRTEAALNNLAPPPDMRQAIMRRVLTEAISGRKPLRVPSWPLAIAAGLVLFAGLWAAYYRPQDVAEHTPDMPPAARPHAGQPFGIITAAGQGTVRYEPADGTPALTDNLVGRAIARGSLMRSAPGATPTVVNFDSGKAEVKLFMDSTIVMKGGAQEQKEEGLVVELTQGEVEVHILRKGYPCEVRTEAGTARAVGTKFKVRLTDEEITMKKMMLVTVISGAVMVGQTMVMAGEQVSVGKTKVGISAVSEKTSQSVKRLSGKIAKLDAEAGSFVVAIPQEVGANKEETVRFTKDTKIVKKSKQTETDVSVKDLTDGAIVTVIYTVAEAGKVASKVYVR